MVYLRLSIGWFSQRGFWRSLHGHWAASRIGLSDTSNKNDSHFKSTAAERQVTALILETASAARPGSKKAKHLTLTSAAT
jgi:hypothetical protein